MRSEGWKIFVFITALGTQSGLKTAIAETLAGKRI